MSDFTKLIALTEDETVKFSIELPKELHKTLILGQSRYTCRYGTLSDGHEKITPAQRYFGAIREMYALSQNIQSQKAVALEAQADLMDEEAALRHASHESEKLRHEAGILRARMRLTGALVTVEDQMRMLDEYNRIRLELKDEVEAKYPEGIEQAEKDNWEAVYKYRMLKEKTPGLARERTDNIPLDPITKAALGLQHGRIDSVAPLQISDSHTMRQLNHEFNKQLTKAQPLKTEQ